MHDFSRSLGNTVKKSRHELNLTQSNVADQVGVETRTILNIENYNANPKMQVLYPLVRTLQIDPWEIFYPELKNQSAAFRQMQILLKECSSEEIEALLPICQAVLSVLHTKSGIAIERNK